MAKYKCPNCGGEFDEWDMKTDIMLIAKNTYTDASSTEVPCYSYYCPWCGQEKGKYHPKRVEYPYVPYEPWAYPMPAWYQHQIWCSNSTR